MQITPKKQESVELTLSATREEILALYDAMQAGRKTDYQKALLRDFATELVQSAQIEIPVTRGDDEPAG